MKIFNLNDGEVLPHRLLLIEGNTEVPSAQSTQVQVASTSNIEATAEPNANGYFKILIPLATGKNAISLINKSDLADALHFNVIHQRSDFSEHFRLLYVTTDESANLDIANAQIRISLGAELLQLFLAEEIRRKYNQRLTFLLENKPQNGYETSGSPQCRVLKCKRSKTDLEQMNGQDLYWSIVDEIINSGHWNPKAKYLAFLAFKNQCDTNANFGCGDVAIVDASGLWTWPEKWQDIQKVFADENPMDDQWKGRRNTIGGCFAETLGAALHELYHALDLGHSKTGIMGLDYANLDDRIIIGQHHNRDHISTCQLNNDQISLIRYHWWLNGRPSDTVEEIILKNGCIQCKDGIAFAELRKDSFALVSWCFDIYKRTIWKPPEDALIAIEQRKNKDDIQIVVVSCKGFIRRL